ncbi:MAG: hypothetical protein PHV74_01590 [Dehalococcoidia bacterium]|nr:hypothetical protein [Dehalococcoidia bacterium]
MVEKVRMEKDCVITGGGAKDIGMVKSVEENTGCSLLVPPEPHLTAALGAALIVWDRVQEKKASG